MRLSKIKPLWTVVVIVAVVAIAGAVIVTLRGGEDQSGPSDSAEPVPKPSGEIPDYPEQAPEYDVADCRYRELEADDGDPSRSDPEAVSPSGEYIAGTVTLDDPLWEPGEKQLSIDKEVEKDLDHLSDPNARAVNSRGVIVGDSYTKSKAAIDPITGWAYYDGKAVELTAPKDLDLPERTEVLPTDVNENGDISGYVVSESTQRNRQEVRQIPLKWEAGSTEATVLDADGDGASASAITADGSVVGAEFHSGELNDGDPSNDVGDVWKWGPDGERETLPSPSGNDIDVAGDWLLTGKHRWNMTDSDDPEKLELSEAAAIDSRGRVFGATGDDKPAVETDSGVEELPVPDDAPGDTRFYAHSVGANSGVVGGSAVTGEDEESESQAAAWDCADG